MSTATITQLNPIVFTFADTMDVRILIENGEPMFCANDVCVVLAHANPRQAIDTHCDVDDVQKLDIIDALGRTQQTNFITEAGVYSLIFGSEKPEAKIFKRWVTHELLPQLRRHGYYGTVGNEKARLALIAETEKVVSIVAKADRIRDEKLRGKVLMYIDDALGGVLGVPKQGELFYQPDLIDAQ